MEEWKEYKLGEIANIQTGPFGSQLHNEDYVDIGTPIVTVEHLGERKFTKQNLPMVSDSDKNRLSKYILKEGDIVFSRVGSVDRCSFVSKDEEGWLFSGRCLRVRCTEISNPLFVYYFFCTPYIRQYVKNIAVGATMPSINTGLLSQLPIILPSFATQQKIANILSSLDDKIEVNRRINEQLEELAGALFKSWFVDFEPFKDGEFVESELVKLGSVINTTSGGTPSRKHMEYYGGNHGWVKSKELNGTFIIDTEETITDDAIAKSSAKLLPEKSILIAMYGATVGQYAVLSKPMTCNQAVCALLPNDDYPYTFLFMFAKNKKDELINKAVGSAQQNISQILIKDLDISNDTKKIKEYHKIVGPAFEIILKNQQEIHHLTTLRDTLLPKLMSGEIDVNEVEI